jgi:hypothetical protein
MLPEIVLTLPATGPSASFKPATVVSIPLKLVNARQIRLMFDLPPGYDVVIEKLQDLHCCDRARGKSSEMKRALRACWKQYDPDRLKADDEKDSQEQEHLLKKFEGNQPGLASALNHKYGFTWPDHHRVAECIFVEEDGPSQGEILALEGQSPADCHYQIVRDCRFVGGQTPGLWLAATKASLCLKICFPGLPEAPTVPVRHGDDIVLAFNKCDYEIPQRCLTSGRIQQVFARHGLGTSSDVILEMVTPEAKITEYTECVFIDSNGPAQQETLKKSARYTLLPSFEDSRGKHRQTNSQSQ